MTQNQEDPQQQNPSLTRNQQQHSPQSPTTPITLEPDPEHPPISDPDDRIEADPNQDDQDDVEMIIPPPDHPKCENFADLKLGAAPEEQGKECLFEEEQKEVALVENFTTFEENQVAEDNGRLFFDGKILGENMEFLRRCGSSLGLGVVESMDLEEQNHGQEVEELEEEEEEEEEEETEQETAIASLMGGEMANHLFQGMQVPFDSFIASSAGNNTIQPGSSHFDHENGFLHHNVNGSNKRMRTGGSDFDMCMEQLQDCMGKARMMYAAKEQDCGESSMIRMNQQLLLNELHKQEAANQQLQASIQSLQQKRQSEAYRYDRHLHLMTDLLDGYRKALKETQKAFAEYRERAPCPQLDVPLYKDVNGGGGLVLSTKELEKREMKKEEEEKTNRLLTKKTFMDFEAVCVARFEAYEHDVEWLNNRLLDVENQIKPLRELVAKRKCISSAPSE